MTTLGELSAAVSEGVDILGNQDRVLAELRELRAIDEAVDNCAAEIARWSRLFSIAALAGFQSTPPALEPLLDAAESAAARLRKHDQGGQPLRRPVDSLVEAMRSSSTELTAAWRDHVATMVSGSQGMSELAAAFASVPGAGDLARRLQSVIGELGGIGQQPPSVEAVARLKELSELVPELLASLVGDDPAVRVFAASLANGGASIEQLTPAVLHWMRDAGFLGSFRIVAGRPAVPSGD